MRPPPSSLGATSRRRHFKDERLGGLPSGFEVYDISNTTSPTPRLPQQRRQSVWNGSPRASRRSIAPARPTWCCATSTPAHSRSTALRATPLSEPLVWVRSAWIGSSAVSQPILRLHP